MNSMYILKFGALLVSIGLFGTFVFVTMDIGQEEIHEKAHNVTEDLKPPIHNSKETKSKKAKPQ